MPAFLHVPPELPNKVPCKLAFVGEAPADLEVETGRPLTGPSGAVFNQLLRAADIDRKEVLVTNVFDFQLEGNDVKSVTVPASARADRPECAVGPLGDRYLLPEYHEQLSRLSDELRDADPDVIVPLGGTALWAFTGATNIGASRGAADLARFTAPGRKIVPTFHPSHLFHSWKLFHVVVGDLLKALREAETPGQVHHTRREIWISPQLYDLKNFRDKYISGSSALSVDIETARGQITCIGFAPSAEKAIVVPFVDWRRPSRSYWTTPLAELTALTWVKEVLESDIPKIFQNGAYDNYWIWDKWHIKTKNWCEDTRILHKSLYAELPADLGFMGSCYAEAPAWKLMRTGDTTKTDE